MTKKRNAIVGMRARLAFGLRGCNKTGTSVKESEGKKNQPSETKATTAPDFDVNQNIVAYTRDTNSGTREGFREKIGLKAASKDDSVLKTSVQQVASNGDRVTSLSKNKYGLGYFSFDTKTEAQSKGIKLLSYDGTVPTQSSILSGEYKLARNFNYCFAEETDAAKKRIVKGFITYMTKSQEGLTIVKQNGGIVDLKATTPTWASLVAADPELKDISKDHSNITVHFGGSTSVEKIARALSAQFKTLAGNFVADHSHTGSGDAFKKTQGTDKGSLDIAFASREFDTAGSETLVEGTFGRICVDGIVVGISAKSPVTNITGDQLKGIYNKEGTVNKWSDLNK